MLRELAFHFRIKAFKDKWRILKRINPRSFVFCNKMEVAKTKFNVVIKDYIVSDVMVLRGAPCGASWDAAKEIIGIKTQFCYPVDPADWDPLYGKSPVHFAADFHKKTLSDAIKISLKRQ